MPETSSPSRIVPAIIVAVIVAELSVRALGVPLAQEAAWIGMGLIIVLSVRSLGLREFYLLSFAICMVVLQFMLSAQPMIAIAAGLDQATFLLVFIFLLGMLHEAASTSPAIAACGEYLTRQPAGRRYYALNVGTASLSVLFNIGVLSFLVPLVQRGIEHATPNDPSNPIRERRQISALLRGFAWAVVWSPTAVAPLAVAELIPGTERGVWMIYGAILFVIVLVIGALEDRFTFRNFRPANMMITPPVPVIGALRFLAACTWLFGMTAIFVWLTGDTVIFGLLMSCPLMLVGWLFVQNGFPNPEFAAKTRARLQNIALENLPKSIPVATTLACSGFIGRTAAELIPAAELAEFLMLGAMPDFVLLGCIPIALCLLSLLALSPIMTAVFFGSLFGALPELPADPTLIAFAISCGWAVSMTFSPFATTTLLISRVSGIPAAKLTWGWNLKFALICAVLVFPFFAVLTGGT